MKIYQQIWKGLKAELLYNSLFYTMGLILIFVINTILLFTGRWTEAQSDFPGLITVWLSLSLFVIVILTFKFRQENRLRLLIVLPVNISVAYWIRTLLLIFYTFSCVLLLLFFDYLGQGNSITLVNFADRFKLFVWLMIILFIPIISQNFYYKFQKSEFRKIWFSLMIMAALFFILVTVAFSGFGHKNFPQIAEFIRLTYEADLSILLFAAILISEILFDYFLVKTNKIFIQNN